MIRLLLICLVLATTNYSLSQDPWINEIHYDNSGTDVNECVEIAGTAGTDLTGWSIQLYNGNGGAVYDTEPITGIIPDEGCGFGTITVCFSSMQNGAPDGIAIVDGSGNVTQFLSYEGTMTATSGPASGMTSIDIGVSEGSSTPAGTSLQLSGAGVGYGDFSWSTSATSTFGSLNGAQSIAPCGGGGGNTITTGAVTGGPFNVDCSTGATGSVAFTSTGVFNAGNNFTAQLSDASGNFSSPTDIGSITLAGTDPSGSISFTIPAATASGTYEIRVISDDPGYISGVSTTITITLTVSCEPPYITSVIINSCNPTCQEGYNELIFGNTGDYSVNLNSTDFQISYGSTAPPGTNPTLTDNLTTNPTTTAALNTAAGCPGTYIDATGMTIPPGASYMLAHDGLCTDALDWAGLCGAGPIYVVYTTDTDWNTNGNFSNSTAAGIRYFNSTITTTTTETFSIDYEYDRTQNSGTDGDFVTYNSAGGAPQAYGDDDCVLNPVVLPIELIDFTGTDVNGNVHLSWTTATEINSDYFILTHSTDGIYFSEFENVDAAGNSIQPIDYEEIHREAQNGVNYYRLIGVDYDGSMKNHGTIAVLVEMSSAFFDPINNQIVFTDKCSANIYALDGKLVAQSNNASVIPFNKKGVFLVIDTVTGKQQKLIIQ